MENTRSHPQWYCSAFTQSWIVTPQLTRIHHFDVATPALYASSQLYPVIWADERIADCSPGCRHGNVYRTRQDTRTLPEYWLPRQRRNRCAVARCNTVESAVVVSPPIPFFPFHSQCSRCINDTFYLPYLIGEPPKIYPALPTIRLPPDHNLVRQLKRWTSLIR